MTQTLSRSRVTYTTHISLLPGLTPQASGLRLLPLTELNDIGCLQFRIMVTAYLASRDTNLCHPFHHQQLSTTYVFQRSRHRHRYIKALLDMGAYHCRNDAMRCIRSKILQFDVAPNFAQFTYRYLYCARGPPHQMLSHEAHKGSRDRA